MRNTGGVRIGRLVIMLVALMMWAVPATASAQGEDADNNNVVGNGSDQTNAGTIGQDQTGVGGAGGGNASTGGDDGSDDNDAVGGSNNPGGDVAQQQNATIQQCNVIAGDDGTCVQSNVTNQVINQGGARVAFQARGAAVRRVAFARGVRLAVTGFDAWMFALLGGASLAGGLTLLARQRRGTL
jgi:hypothetical protein